MDVRFDEGCDEDVDSQTIFEVEQKNTNPVKVCMFFLIINAPMLKLLSAEIFIPRSQTCVLQTKVCYWQDGSIALP